jgi:hypothetical protein
MNREESLLCKQANQMDLVDYLNKLEHNPQKIRGNDYWYLSPLRQERTASFKVNRKLNLWYDHGNGKGRTLVDFGILYYDCSVKDLLTRLKGEKALNFSFQQPSFLPAVEKKETTEDGGKIKIISSNEISNLDLLHYLSQRKIPLSIAKEFCQEICFELYEKKQLAIGFKNDSGGYELRNQNFKGSSSPKEPKINCVEGAKNLAVFEGFFDFLSFQTLLKSSEVNKLELPIIQSDFLILNSISFFEKQRQTMEQYANIHLFLDRDKRGIESTIKALQWSKKYKDQSPLYKPFKDLNEYLKKSDELRIKQSHNRGLRL